VGVANPSITTEEKLEKLVDALYERGVKDGYLPKIEAVKEKTMEELKKLAFEIWEIGTRCDGRIKKNRGMKGTMRMPFDELYEYEKIRKVVEEVDCWAFVKLLFSGLLAFSVLFENVLFPLNI
jgi:hypothetical protein